ncbi:unnamed protein product, partial [Closterium sp. NIES-53]
LSMAPLLAWMRENMLKERPEMFLKGPTVRPGVLVLIIDVDWELTGNVESMMHHASLNPLPFTYPSRPSPSASLPPSLL